MTNQEEHAPTTASVLAAERERVSDILDKIQDSLDSNGSYCECSGYQRTNWLGDQLNKIRAGGGNAED